MELLTYIKTELEPTLPPLTPTATISPNSTLVGNWKSKDTSLGWVEIWETGILRDWDFIIPEELKTYAVTL